MRQSRLMIRELQDLGFTEYEAKAYLALLEEAPLTGYAVAGASGVPRSKIYEVLGGLARRGAVFRSHGEPAQYAPLPPEELIARRREELDASIAAAEAGLKSYAASAAYRDVIWDITGREEVMNRACEVASRAERQILLEVWGEDAPELAEPLEEAAGRGVDVTVVAYGEVDYPFAEVFSHDLVDEVTQGLGGRWLVLCADLREIVAGIISLGAESRAAWSSHPGLVVPVTSLVTHDLHIVEMLREHREELEGTFGPGLLQLRQRYNALGVTRADLLQQG
jgi:sugar-specific transcriptional regulator TrmB